MPLEDIVALELRVLSVAINPPPSAPHSESLRYVSERVPEAFAGVGADAYPERA